MSKKNNYSFKQKLRVVQSVKAGGDSCLSAARKTGCGKSTVQRWLNLYKRHGVSGLKLHHGSYDGQFKIQVIRYMLKNRLSLMRTAAIFGIPQGHTVGLWLKKYECQGDAGLLKEARGRKKSLMTKKTNKKKKDTSTADPAAEKVMALQKEVEYLRAENAFLKKLDALIQQEKTAKAQGRRQKPSRN